MAEQRGHPQGHTRKRRRQTAYLTGAMPGTEKPQDGESEDLHSNLSCDPHGPGDLGQGPAMSWVSVFLSVKWRDLAAHSARSLSLGHSVGAWPPPAAARGAAWPALDSIPQHSLAGRWVQCWRGAGHAGRGALQRPALCVPSRCRAVPPGPAQTQVTRQLSLQ